MDELVEKLQQTDVSGKILDRARKQPLAARYRRDYARMLKTLREA